MLKNTSQAALERFCDALQWPPHLSQKYPNPKANAAAALSDYFQWSKGNWGVADFLTQCMEAEIPLWLRDMCKELAKHCNPHTAVAAPAAGAANGA